MEYCYAIVWLIALLDQIIAERLLSCGSMHFAGIVETDLVLKFVAKRNFCRV